MIFLKHYVLVLGFIVNTSFARVKPIIIGGGYASIEVYAHSVYMELYYHNASWSIGRSCGASILNEYIILTAAHCIINETISDRNYLLLSVGYSNVTGRLQHRVVSIKVHEGYNTNLPDTLNDIALLKLKNALVFGKTVKRVAIMKSPPCYGPASFAGWGIIDVDKTMTANLKHIRGLEVWSREKCLDRHSFLEFLPRDILCAGYSFPIFTEGFVNSAHKENSLKAMIQYGALDARVELTLNRFFSRGDSGCALLVEDYIQIGISSYTAYDADPKLKNESKLEKEYHAAIVYTNVAYHYDWIMQNSLNMYCDNSTYT